MQDLFREKADRLYHWADDPDIPADNNRAERELRPLVIARKTSFGSQSDAGAKIRETLTTALHTLRKRVPDVTTAFQFGLTDSPNSLKPTRRRSSSDSIHPDLHSPPLTQVTQFGG
jgi:hypothetical protein